MRIRSRTSMRMKCNEDGQTVRILLSQIIFLQSLYLVLCIENAFGYFLLNALYRHVAE